MSVIDQWVEKSINLPNVGSMTHAERMSRAMELEDPDLVPCAPQFGVWAITYAGYDFFQTWDDVDKVTDAVIKSWYDYRVDLIWPYVCLSHGLDPFLTPSQREKAYNLRDGKSGVLTLEITDNLDEAIKLLEQRPWDKYGSGRLDSHWAPHFEQLLDFQKKMGNNIPIVLPIGNVSNIAETIVGVQHFIKWTVTEPRKLHYYLQLMAERLFDTIEQLADFARGGVDYLCVFTGGRTWGPRQLEEFSIYDRIFINKAAKYFKYPFHHICGNNLPTNLAMVTTMPYSGFQYDEPMQQINWSWPQWSEWVARLSKGKMCPMNGVTTQDLAYRHPEDVARKIKEYIYHTTPYNTAVVMPGCELALTTPNENVAAMVAATRQYGKYPQCKKAANPIWTDDEFNESRVNLTGKLPKWIYYDRKYDKLEM